MMKLASDWRHAIGLIMSNDPLIQAAQDRIREIIAEREELESFIRAHRNLSAKLLKPKSPQPEPPTPVAPQNHRPSTTTEILEAVGKVLNEHGRPMSLADLHLKLSEVGVVIPGKDPRNNLSAKLYASDRFVTQRGVGWWFASQLSKNEGPAGDGEALNVSGVSAPDVGG